MMRRATRWHVTRAVLATAALVLLTLVGIEGYGRLHARHLRDRLLEANTADVPAVVAEMGPWRHWLDPLLHEAAAEPDNDRRKQLHLSIALLPADPGQLESLYGRLLEADAQELPVLREALRPHQAEVSQRLWPILVDRQADMDRRFRAAAALAGYAPEDRRWEQVSGDVAARLVLQNTFVLGQWAQALKEVRQALLPRLASFLDDDKRSGSERAAIAGLYRTFAEGQPEAFARLERVLTDPNADTVVEKIEEKALVKAEDRPVLKVSDQLTRDDPLDKKLTNSHAKVHTVKLAAGKTYFIDMVSKQLDSYLRLEDVGGEQLGEDDDSGGDLNARIVFNAVKDGSYRVIATSFEGGKTGPYTLSVYEGVTRLQEREVKNVIESAARRRANVGAALVVMGRGDKVWPLLAHSPDPSLRSLLIDRFAAGGVEPKALLAQLEQDPDVSIQRALWLSLGEYGLDRLPLSERRKLVPRLVALYRDSPDPGLHSTAEWLLRRWQSDGELKDIDRQLRTGKVEDQRQWYVNRQGQTMMVVRDPPPFWMGSPPEEPGRVGDEERHRRRIGRSFAIAAKEVTVEQFRQFRNNHKHVEQYAPTVDCPVNDVTWYQAAEYCNWLSKQEGIPETQWCYEPNAQGQYAEGMKIVPDALERVGYRLPTEAEWEYACRAGAATMFAFGADVELIGKYAWYMSNSLRKSHGVGRLRPNDLGLFDMHGNAWEWCQSAFAPYAPYPKAAAAEVIGDITDKENIVRNTLVRVVRGGSVNDGVLLVRCGPRARHVPTYCNAVVGFRPARTFR
jgi:formylglycine-generating enzyme required for sulfatase activity